MVVEFTEILRPLENAVYWTWQNGCTRLEIGYLNGWLPCVDTAVLPLSTLHGCSPGFRQSLL